MWRLTTLGGLALVRLDEPEPDGGGELAPRRRALALLAVLAAAGERGVARDRLLLYFWPESHAGRARNALKQTLFRLRHELAASDPVVGATTLRLNPAIVASDVMEFEAALAAGDLERSIALYRGPFLHGVASGRLPEFDEWAAAERARLAARFAAALESLASAAGTRGDHATAARWWRRLATAEPTDARVARGLMSALGAAGDHEGALQYFRLHELLLAEEFGATPEESVIALAQRLRSSQTSAASQVPASLVELDPAALAGHALAMEDGSTAAPPSPGSRVRRPRAGTIATATLGVAVIALVIRVWSSVRVGPVESVAPTVAVLPFSVRSAGSAAYLQEGLVELLSRNLDGAGDLRAADPKTVLGMLGRIARDGDVSRLPLSARTAEQLGASHVVVGNVATAGGQLRIGATIHARVRGDDSLRPVGRVQAEGDTARLFAVVDLLTRRLLAAFPRGRRDRLERTAAVTTTSLPALKAYLTGEVLYRERRWTEALEAYQLAVREDSSFALAHYRVSSSADWAGRSELVVPAAERAYRMSGRLGTHDSLLVHANLAFRRQEVAEAEHIYREIVAGYPDDVEAWYQLGEVLFHLNPFRGQSVTEAREPFTRVVRLDPEHDEALLHLLRIAAREGRRGEVDTLARRVLARTPTHRQLEVRAFRALTVGTPAEAAEALGALRRGTDLDRYVTAWRVAVFGRNLEASAHVASIMVEPGQTPTTRQTGHEFRATIHAARGRWRMADAELEAIVPSVPPYYMLSLRALLAVVPGAQQPPGELRRLLATLRIAEASSGVHSADGDVHREADGLRLLHSIGIVSAALGDSSRALDAARRLAVWAGGSDSAALNVRRARAMARSVRAQVASRSGRPEQVLSLLASVMEGRAVTESYMQGLDHFTFAESLRASGALDAAVRWYGTLADVSFHDLPFLALAELRQAQIHGARGDHARAAAHYSRFTALWRDCDAELRPLVTAAERRLVELRARQRP